MQQAQGKSAAVKRAVVGTTGPVYSFGLDRAGRISLDEISPRGCD